MQVRILPPEPSSKGESIKLYLDDERNTPEGYHRIYRAPEAIKLLCEHYYKGLLVDEISLDHDLGDGYDVGNGNDVLLWIEERAFTDAKYIPPFIKVHSANPAARRKMEMGANKVNSLREQRIQKES